MQSLFQKNQLRRKRSRRVSGGRGEPQCYLERCPVFSRLWFGPTQAEVGKEGPFGYIFTEISVHGKNGHYFIIYFNSLSFRRIKFYPLRLVAFINFHFNVNLKYGIFTVRS